MDRATSVSEPDPTLAALIPQRSVRRNLTLALTAVLVLAAVWASPHLLRPSVVSDSSDGSTGSWSALAPHRQVLAAVRLEPDGWPSVGVQSVADLPGAEVAGTWLLADALPMLDVRLDPGAYATGLDYLRAECPRRYFGAATQLPQRVDNGKTTQLLILWDIIDCSLLSEGERPEIELRTIVGTTRHERLDEVVSPAFHLDTLAAAGICPMP